MGAPRGKWKEIFGYTFFLLGKVERAAHEQRKAVEKTERRNGKNDFN